MVNVGKYIKYILVPYMDPVGIEVKHQSEIFPKTEPEYQATHMKRPSNHIVFLFHSRHITTIP